MLSLGAAKVSLSSISSQELWKQSGRFSKGRESEFFHLKDRRDTEYLLSPTHEEEITTIVKHAVKSYKDLPLRLYQVTRKYRDEARPRQGLLRGREFLMKDLYTFDTTESDARQTYEKVRQAYSAFFDELRLPYLVANADSGNMGGTLSHEYHFASSSGEDNIISCDSCDYSINEELYVARLDPNKPENSIRDGDGYELRFDVTKDRQTLVVTGISSRFGTLNPRAIKALVPDIDAGIENAVQAWVSAADNHKAPKVVFVTDPRDIDEHLGKFYENNVGWEYVDGQIEEAVIAHDPEAHPISHQRMRAMHSLGSDNEVQKALEAQAHDDDDDAANAEAASISRHKCVQAEQSSVTNDDILLTAAQEGDSCPQCRQGKLKIQQAVEIGHTFHLGTRYSEPLQLQVKDSNNKQAYVSMGCHGIGVSRLIGACASLLADKSGLNWPLTIAPFGVVLVTAPTVSASEANELYDKLATYAMFAGSDVAIDDRDRQIGWKLNDADLVGYPFIVVMGRFWGEKKAVELQCRRLIVKEVVSADDVGQKILDLSKQL